MAAGATSSRGRPRRAAISSGRTRSFSACMVACTMLIGFEEPRLLESTSWMPAHSSTARTGPPAMTPVPGLAGFSSTTPAAAVTHDHQGGEAEAPTTLDDLGHAVDGNHALDVVALLGRRATGAPPAV